MFHDTKSFCIFLSGSDVHSREKAKDKKKERKSRTIIRNSDLLPKLNFNSQLPSKIYAVKNTASNRELPNFVFEYRIKEK